MLACHRSSLSLCLTLCLAVCLTRALCLSLTLSASHSHSLSHSILPLCYCAAIQGETNIEDPGGFGILKMESGLVATVCAGNSLSGAASIRLCVAEDLRLLIAALPPPPTASIYGDRETERQRDRETERVGCLIYHMRPSLLPLPVTPFGLCSVLRLCWLQVRHPGQCNRERIHRHGHVLRSSELHRSDRRRAADRGEPQNRSVTGCARVWGLILCSLRLAWLP